MLKARTYLTLKSRIKRRRAAVDMLNLVKDGGLRSNNGSCDILRYLLPNDLGRDKLFRRG